MHNPACGSAYLRMPPPRSLHSIGTALSTASRDLSKAIHSPSIASQVEGVLSARVDTDISFRSRPKSSAP
jgi:hypothetical protein